MLQIPGIQSPVPGPEVMHLEVFLGGGVRADEGTDEGTAVSVGAAVGA